jgi:hypothetical protein
LISFNPVRTLVWVAIHKNVVIVKIKIIAKKL